MKKIVKIIFPIFIFVFALAIPFAMQNIQIHTHNTTTCSTCVKIKEIQNEIKFNLSTLDCHNCKKTNQCLYCNQINSSKEALSLILNYKHRCSESNKILSYITSFINVEYFTIISIFIFSLILPFILKQFFNIERISLNKSLYSPILLKDKLSD